MASYGPAGSGPANEDAPALRRSFFQAGHAGSIPVTRSHRDVQVRHHSPGVNLRRFSPLDHPRAIRARLARRLAGIAGGVTVALDQRREGIGPALDPMGRATTAGAGTGAPLCRDF